LIQTDILQDSQEVQRNPFVICENISFSLFNQQETSFLTMVQDANFKQYIARNLHKNSLAISDASYN